MQKSKYQGRVTASFEQIAKTAAAAGHDWPQDELLSLLDELCEAQCLQRKALPS